MKLCIDVEDKYEGLFNKLTEKQRNRLLKGLSAHANSVLAVLDNTAEVERDTMIKILTSAMFLLSTVTGNPVEDDDDEEEGED